MKLQPTDSFYSRFVTGSFFLSFTELSAGRAFSLTRSRSAFHEVPSANWILATKNAARAPDLYKEGGKGWAGTVSVAFAASPWGTGKTGANVIFACSGDVPTTHAIR